MTQSDMDMAVEGLEALALLRWHVENGADEAIGEEPVDRFAEAELAQVHRKSDANVAEPTTTAPSSAGLSSIQALPRHEEALVSARHLARTANTLSELKSAIETFEGCGLKQTAHSTVVADGNPKAGLMLIGEAPGRDEDRQGLPFVGRSGQFLDRMFAAIERDRRAEDPSKAVYITNILPWRPPGNRNPSPEEIALCLPFLERHIELVSPKIIVALGGVSAKQLLDTTVGIMKLRGKWGAYKTTTCDIPTLPMFHPAYLLRQPAQKRYAWADLQLLEKKLQASATR